MAKGPRHAGGTGLAVAGLVRLLASERELGDLGLSHRDDELAAGPTDCRVLEAVVLDKPSQERQPPKIGLSRLFDKHLQR
jgi:hypothetical protein